MNESYVNYGGDEKCDYPSTIFPFLNWFFTTKRGTKWESIGWYLWFLCMCIVITLFISLITYIIALGSSIQGFDDGYSKFGKELNSKLDEWHYPNYNISNYGNDGNIHGTGEYEPLSYI